MDESSFDQVLAKHAPAIRLYVRSLLPGYNGADDVSQEVLIKVWQKREEYTPGTNFKAWAFQIARYLVMNEVKKLSRSKFVAMDEKLMDQIHDYWLRDEKIGTDEEHAALEQCLEGLAEEDRQILHIRYATEVSVEKYAEQEGLRSGTLKARLFRLREALRRCMELRLNNQ